MSLHNKTELLQLSRKELTGGKTKKEKEILKALTDLHNKSGKRNFFIGELKKRADIY